MLINDTDMKDNLTNNTTSDIAPIFLELELNEIGDSI